MKVFSKVNERQSDDVPLATATPSRKDEGSRPSSVRDSATVSSNDAAAINFLRQFKVLVGASRLYERNHPRLSEMLSSAEHQLHIALAAHSEIVFAIERNGIIVPRYDRNIAELLYDPRGELRGLAVDLLRSGLYSLVFTAKMNIGELDLFSREVSRMPRNTTPGDTASRKAWDAWLLKQQIGGIRLNVPTERRDSLLLASFVSAVLAYDEPLRSAYSRPSAAQTVDIGQVAGALHLLTKLAAPRDAETQTSAEGIARRTHSVLSASEPAPVSLIVHAVSRVKPREGESLVGYLDRLRDTLILTFATQQFHAGVTTPPELMRLFARLDQGQADQRGVDRGQADWGQNDGPKSEPRRFSGSQPDEMRICCLCERFWSALPVRERGKVLRSAHAWAVPTVIVAAYLDPLALAAEKKKAEAAGHEGRQVLSAYARCLESEEEKARRATAAGLVDLTPQIELLWPHASTHAFGSGIVQALLRETSPGIAGLLSAVVDTLARLSLAKHEYSEFERILEALESSPRDDEHAHISALLARILNDEQWLYLVDEAVASHPLHPVIPRLLRRDPNRLIDRLGLLLTAPQGIDSLPAMVRLVHGTGEPVLGALEARLYEPRRHRIATAILLLASADPKRLANALPRALVSWEWNLQDLAVSELARWTNPSVVAACAQAFAATVTEAHPMVVPCMIDHLGIAQETAALPLLMKVMAGEHLLLRDIYLRIKAVEAVGRMRVAEAAPILLRIVRERSGLAHGEPAALRVAAEDALKLIESRYAITQAGTAKRAASKSTVAHARVRRYARARVKPPLPATIEGTHGGTARVHTISLGGAFLECERRLSTGESVQVEIRSGLRRIQATAVVRSLYANGCGVEFVHMKPESRERLRRLVEQRLQ